MEIRIYYEDTDAGGIVYHANYIKFCERARSEMFFSAGINFDENGYFVVSEIAAKFTRPAILGDLLEIRSNLSELGKASVTLEQAIYRVGRLNEVCEDELVFKAKIKLAYLAHGKPRKFSGQIAEFFRARLR